MEDEYYKYEVQRLAKILEQPVRNFSQDPFQVKNALFVSHATFQRLWLTF